MNLLFYLSVFAYVSSNLNSVSSSLTIHILLLNHQRKIDINFNLLPSLYTLPNMLYKLDSVGCQHVFKTK